MFYHNHRRYNSGERAHNTPYEILSGKEQKKDWMQLLFETIDENNASTDNGQRVIFSGLSVNSERLHGIGEHETSDDYVNSVRLSQ